jgi:hypothetical protein
MKDNEFIHNSDENNLKKMHYRAEKETRIKYEG